MTTLVIHVGQEILHNNTEETFWTQKSIFKKQSLDEMIKFLGSQEKEMTCSGKFYEMVANSKENSLKTEALINIQTKQKINNNTLLPPGSKGTKQQLRLERKNNILRTKKKKKKKVVSRHKK